MSPVLLYLLKANGALLLFAVAYFGLLRRLTFFTLNRFYLLFALLFAAVYPVLPVPALLPAEAASGPTAAMVAIVPTIAGAVARPTAPALDWELLGLRLYAGGAGLLLARLLVQLLSLWRLRRTTRPAVVHGQAIRALPGAMSPFSFWQTVYLNPLQHPAAELDAVLRHEQVHVRQWHTLDVLLAQVAQALAWCNPAAWLLRRALLDNLEYLADRAALQTGLDRRAYQYSLLRLSHGVGGPSLVSHFTFPSLKNRVAMMNTPFSSTGQLARYFVAGPLVLAVTLGFSAARAQSAGPAVPASALAAAGNAASPSRIYYMDGQLTSLKGNDDLFGDVATMKILKGSQVQQVLGQDVAADWAAVITTNKNRNRADVLALNKKVDAAGAQDTHFKIGPAVAPAKHQLPAGIKTYLAKTYPSAKLTSWAISEKASEKAPYVRYLAGITQGPEKRMLYFNNEEQPVTPAPKTAERGSTAERKLGTAVGIELLPKGKGFAPSPATTLSTAQAEPPFYYIDGQLQKQGASANVLNNVAPNDIASMNIFKGLQARQLFGAGKESGVIVITTKANQSRPDVLAFNQKAGIGIGIAPAPATGPEKQVGTMYLAAPALAYITKNHPDARLISVTEIRAADGKTPLYKAEIAVGRRPEYLVFDGQGQLIP
ncbi:hypothetical protein I2I05_02305 [Hymenobacter sp. BT683]|uniref:Peptidase M56 domain-containing protein n=1 Tax=Hymenobacter jeongseonensis TaxID=2791027 RepID=A0ABS0ID02_9BACT|nr:M56 family metallopeptidase [Hymenobacter jeongseonensis]MBF9236218.1 hypothetical protein [Hymenobacter jeongseonensis]